MAGTSEVHPDWAPVAARIRYEATDDWNDQVAVDRLVGKGGQFVRGWGRLTGPGRITVGERTFQARRGVVIGTGAAAVIPPIDGLADTPYWTNRGAIETKELPASLLVLGGGAVGLELAQMFAGFGVPVTVIEALDRLLAVEERESSALAAHTLAADWVTVVTGAAARRVEHDADLFTATLTDGTAHRGQWLLVAIGRRPDLTKLGVETVGLDPAARADEVDERMRAGERLWAIGDVTGRGAFTHIAMYRAGVAIRDILGQRGPPADYRALPRVTFTDPEIGAVGLTEAQARAEGIRVHIGTAQVPSTARGWIHKAGNDGLIKLVATPTAGCWLGATSAGPAGGRCWARWPSRCTARYRSIGSAT